ncbi:hypothetical protein B0H11DRAFT_2346137 [Mycena galericulata]|nr:hypothetical protein B0H11DRAFT_2346137 [Mycena galericulata]
MSDSYVPLVIAPATLSYQTDWACVETTTPGVSFRRDDALAGYALYDKVTMTATSIMFSQPYSEVFESGVVPFLIVGDGNPIDIKITKGRDRDTLGDYRGSASVKLGDNSYQNDVTSSQTNERRFDNCPLPLTTSFIPRNPGAQPIQLIVNLTNNIYPTGNSGGPPFGPDSATTVKLTLLNYLSGEDDSNPTCDMVLAEGSPCVTRGKTISPPTEVKSMSKTTGNAGVYQNATTEGRTDIRGAVGYIIPGGNSILVIYFDAVKCRLLTVDAGTAIDSKVVNRADTEGQSMVTGSIVLDGGGSNFGARATSELVSENLVEMQVSLRNVMTVPGPPEEGKQLMLGSSLHNF